MIRLGSALGAATVALVALPSTASAQQEGRFSVDTTATAGYSNNPFTVSGSDTGSGLVSLDVAPRYVLSTARSTFALSGSANLQQYVRRYLRNDSYAAAVDYSVRPSERVTAHTRVDIASAVLGAYGFAPGGGATNAAGSGTTGTTTTGSGTSTITSAPFTDVGLFGLRNRRRLARLSGDVNMTLSARDSLTVSAYGEAARYRNFPQLGNYEAYSGSLSYSRRVSERFTVGLRGSASTYKYRSNGDSRVFPLEATLSGRLNAVWTIDGALGATFVDSDSVGSTKRTSVSGSLNVCRRGELSTMCAQASRQVLPTGLVGSQYVTAAGLNWSKRLSQRDNLSLNGSYSKVGGDNRRLVPGVLPLQTEYAQATLGYDRQLTQRMRVVASTTYRQLLDGNAGRPVDFGGQLGLSYRFGDQR